MIDIVRNRVRIGIGILLSLMLIVTSGMPVLAYNAFGYTLNGGVGNYGYNTRNYWVDSSASNYTMMIDTAVSTWVHTTSRLGITTPISLARMSSGTLDVAPFVRLKQAA